MILLIDTTTGHVGEKVAKALLERGATSETMELVDTTHMHISHCTGCNHCWLKTPGVCTIQDDYLPLLKKMSTADQMWLISDTHFGFVTYQTKNIVDRIMPLVTMYLYFQDKQMRHVMRYDHQPDVGIVFTGRGDQAYLERWCGRVAVNLGTKSLGAFPEERSEEALACML